LETFKDDALRHEPRSKFLYSTFGYNLLGSVADGTSGKSFMLLLDELTLTPAKMDQTLADNQFAAIGDRTHGYIRPTQQTLKKLGAGIILKAGELYNSPLPDVASVRVAIECADLSLTIIHI